MKLFTDYATPYELSVVARASADERERERVSLATYLPTITVPGTSITTQKGENGLVDIAEYRAYDAETAFGSAPGGRRQTVELPALGQQARVAEYDQLVQLNIANAEERRNTLGQVSIRLGRAVADRLELARGEAIQTGKIAFNEGGFIAEVNFDRDPEMNATAGKLWSDTSADPVADLENWVEAYTDRNGDDPAAIIVSKRVLAAIKASDVMRKVATNGMVAQAVTNDFVNSWLAANGLPALVEYNRKIRRGGKPVNVLSPDTLVFVPSADAEAGNTVMGTTLEARHPDYAIPAGEQAGIVVGAYQKHNPMGIELNAAALGLPVLRDANAFMTAKVL